MSISGEETLYLPPNFAIDFSKTTIPMPEKRYLREPLLAIIHNLINRGLACEITGKDGDGKSTMLKEAARYLQDQGYPTMVLDARITLNRGDWDSIQDFIEHANLAAGCKPVILFDNTDELWFHDGVSTEELIKAKQNRDLNPEELRKYNRYESKSDFINFLLSIRSKAGIVVTAHSEDSSSVERFKDFNLRNQFLKLNPTPIFISTPYSKGEVGMLLRHFDVTNNTLIEIIEGLTANHSDIKRLACLKLHGKWLQDVFEEAIKKVSVVDQERWRKTLQAWLEKGKETIHGE